MFREVSESEQGSQIMPALDYARAFRALGDSTRLRIFEFLRSCACPVAVDETGAVRPVTGPTAGEVCCHITGMERINSTISHHLRELRLAGIIDVERCGKHMVCRVNQAAAAALAHYLGETGGTDNERECCE